MSNSEKKELIAFYNVENLFPPDPLPIHRLDPTNSGLRNWDERKYRLKISKIAHVFDLIQESEGVLPMIIGLAEIQRQKPLEDLVKMSPFDSNYGIVHYDSMDERGVDVALLYDKSKIEILSSEPITYFFEFEKNSAGKYDTTRDVLCCRVKYLNEFITIYFLHLPSKREKDINKSKRIYILNELKERVIKIMSHDEFVIIGGDFNENPDAEMIENLLYDNSSNIILRNPYLNLYRNHLYSTFHNKSGLLFDQMILSETFFDNGSILQFTEAKIFQHQNLINRDQQLKGRPFRTYSGTRYLGGFSDHFPIITELKMKGYK